MQNIEKEITTVSTLPKQTIVRSSSNNSFWIINDDIVVEPRSQWITTDNRQSRMWHDGYRTKYCDKFIYDVQGNIKGYDGVYFDCSMCENYDHIFDMDECVESKKMQQAFKHGFMMEDFCFICITDIGERRKRQWVLSQAIARDFQIETYKFDHRIPIQKVCNDPIEIIPLIISVDDNLIKDNIEVVDCAIDALQTLNDMELLWDSITYECYLKKIIESEYTYPYNDEFDITESFGSEPMPVLIKKRARKIKRIKTIRSNLNNEGKLRWFETIPTVARDWTPLELINKLKRKIKLIFHDILGYTKDDDIGINYKAMHYKPRSFVSCVKEVAPGELETADFDFYDSLGSRKFDEWLDSLQRGEVLEPQMDNAKGESDERTVSASNVVLGETENESVAITSKILTPEYFKLSTNEACTSYKDVTDRFTFIKEFEWNTEQRSDQKLLSSTLPGSFLEILGLKDRNIRANVPMLVPFVIHRYWRGDIEIKIHVNSNKFQTGQLQCSFYYGSSFAYKTRDTIFACSQLPHVLVNAGASNEATLLIPYKYFTPFLHIKNRTGYVAPLDLGLFQIFVNVPLRTATNGPRTCGVSLFMRLINSQFTGMIDGNIVEPQMMRAVGGVVDKFIGDLNCDLPSNTSAPSYVVPTGTHSWSFGTNSSEPLHSLRLDGSAKGSGSGSDTGLSETAIAIPCRTYGMLRHITWSSVAADRNKSGYLLWSMDVHPIGDKDKLDSRPGNESDLTEYSVPPVGVVSSLFQYWRGSLEFRFDIIASQFHTGRLLIAYIPGSHNGNRVTIEQARNSAYAVFSLQESQSFTFVVPYIADTPWWYRKYAGPQRRSEFSAPSRIYIFVLNPLIPMESVSPIVTIVPYMRASTDFELAVPVQPSLGLTNDVRNTIPKDEKLELKKGYYPAFAGSWRNFDGNKRYILRYSNITDEVSQANIPRLCLASNEFVYWRLDNAAPSSAWVLNTTNPSGENADAAISYVVAYTVPDGYTYVVPFVSQASAREFAYYAKIDGNIGRAEKYAVPYIKDGNYSPSDWNPPRFTPIIERLPPPRQRRTLITDEDLNDYVFPQMMGEQLMDANILQPVSALPTTNAGQLTFSESFTDLKDLARRYQLYFEGTIKYDMSQSNSRSNALVQFPAIPSGLNLDVNNPTQIWNFLREGSIPIICSGYRYFRGDLKFRISLSDLPGNIWVQHHPDKPLDYEAAVVPEPNITKADRFRNHGYAFYIQSAHVNNIIEFSVPFYQPGVFGILNRLKEPQKALNTSDYAGLGDIVIGLTNISNTVTDATTTNMSVYYAFGDSMKLEVFTGFPNMVFCDEVFECVEPQMMSPVEVQSPGLLGSITGGAISSIAGSVTSSLLSNPIQRIKRDVKNSVVEGVTEALRPKTDQIREELSQVKGIINNFSDTMKDNVGDWMMRSGMTVALTELLHVVMNPTPTTLAVSVSGIILMMFQSTLDIAITMSSQLISVLNELFVKARSLFSLDSLDPSQESSAVEPQSAGTSDLSKEAKAITSIIFLGVLNMLGLTIVGPKRVPDLLKGISSELTLLNNVMTFLNNCGDTILYYVKYCLGASNLSAKDMELLEAEFPEIEDWLKEVHYLLDPRVKCNISHNVNDVNRVFDACIYGSLILSSNLHVSIPGGKIINDCYRDICKVRDDIVEMGNHPDVRFKCYPVWMFGPPGVGKSFITQDIVKRMLHRINYRTKETMIYWLTCNTKYWNGIKNPPCIARDDAYNLDGLALDEELANHFMIDSNCILNPNMAAVEDKNKRLNPLIYFMNSNFAFPTIPTAKCPEAVYRRRKALIEVDWTDDVKKKYPGLTDSDEITDRQLLATKNHLKFRFAQNVKQPDTSYGPWLSYDQMLDRLCESFFDFYKRERENFVERVRTAYALDSEFIPPREYDDCAQTIPETRKIPPLKQRFLEIKKRAERDLIIHSNGSDAPEGVLPLISKYIADIGMYFTSLVAPQSPYQSSEIVIDGEDFRALKIFGAGRHSMFEIIEKFAAHTGLPEYILDNLFSNLDMADLKFSDLCQVLLSSGTLEINETLSQHSPDFYFPFNNMFLRALARKIDCTAPRRIVPMSDGDDCLRQYVERLLIVDNIRNNNEYHKAIVAWLADDSQNGYFHRFMKLICDNGKFDPGKIMDLDNNRGQVTNAEIVEFFLQYDMVLNAVTELVYKYPKPHQFQCPLSQFFFEQVAFIDRVKYCAFRNCFIARGRYGLSYKCDMKCSCKTCLFKNPLFLRMMSHLWDMYHEVGDRPDFELHSGERQDYHTWILETKAYLSCWWGHYLEPSITSALRFFIEWWPTITRWIGAFIAIAGCASACKHFLRKTEDFTLKYDSLEGVNYFKWDQPKHPKPMSKNFAPKTFRAPAKTQNLGNLEKVMILKKKIEENTVVIHCNFQKKDQPNGIRTVLNARGIALRNRSILVLRHYYEEFAYHAQDADAKFRIYYKKQDIENSYELTYDDLFTNISSCIVGSTGRFEYPSNFAILELPKFCHQFKDLMPWIATKDMQAENHAREGHLIVVGGESSFNIPFHIQHGVIVRGEDGITEIPMDVSFRYHRQAKGLCGAMLCVTNLNNGAGAIIGVHVAGSPQTGGSAEPVYREMFDMYFRMLPDEMPGKTLPPDEFNYFEPKFEPLGQKQGGRIGDTPWYYKDAKVTGAVSVFGTVPKEYVHHESGKTRIVPSLLHDKIYEHTTEPNPLKPDDPRQPLGSHPLIDGCKKHGLSTVTAFRPSDLDIVQEDVFELMKAKMIPVRQKVGILTDQQAICGDVNIPYFDAMKFNTSEGFPLVTMRPKGAHNKKWLFDLEEDKDGYKLKGFHFNLEVMMATREMLYKRGIAPFTIYIDFLKDYRLPIEKCKIPGKTRIVSVAPVQTCIDFRRYCTDYTAAYKANRIKMEHGIGINPDSMEWTDLVRYLHEVGTTIVCGDYSNYGPNLSSAVVYRANQNMKKWYEFHDADPEHIRRIGWVMDNEILCPIHLCEDVVYKVNNGIASGSPITGEHNSEPNKMYIRLMWLYIMRRDRPDLATMAAFRQHVRVVVYGDDIIICVSDEVKELFNLVTISAMFKEYGITFTGITKDDKMIPYTSIFEAQFLKRGFALHPKRPGVFLAPVDINSIQECINWCHTCDDITEATLEVCRASMDLAYSHGPEFYNNHRDRIQKELLRMGIGFECKSWMERDNEIFGESLISEGLSEDTPHIKLEAKASWFMERFSDPGGTGTAK